MKNIIKLCLITSLLMFSFFYINIINNYLVENNTLLFIIEEKSELYEVSPINAYVYGNYIIPGINGLSINVYESYYSMRAYDVFIESFLVYDEVIPEISVSNYMELYIEKGNDSLRNISIIIEDNVEIENYIIKENIISNKLIDYNDLILDNVFEYINNEVEYFKKLDNLIDNKICIVNNSNEDLCKEYSYYLVKPMNYVNNINIIEIKNNLYSGEIIYIENLLTLENFIIIYNEILFRDYNLVYLSKLISE